jgi:NAD(P)H-dependent FMN reductase
MNVLVISTSLDPRSRIRRLARFCLEELRVLGCQSSLLIIRAFDPKAGSLKPPLPLPAVLRPATRRLKISSRA